MNQARVARNFGVSTSTVSRLMLSKDHILQYCEQGNKDRKRRRQGKYCDIEKALFVWAKEKIGQGVRLSTPLLKEKAIEIGSSQGREFKPSEGWMCRWKIRHNISFKKGRGEKQDVDMAAVKEMETVGDKGEYDMKGTELCGGKKASKDRCNRTSGTKKCRPSVVVEEKSSKTRSHPPDLCTLPVMYDDSKNRWMTGDIFKKWLLDWDADLQAQSQQVCLLVCNSAVHLKDDELSNIMMKFVPPAPSTAVRPIQDEEVIKNGKGHHRSKPTARMTPARDELETIYVHDGARPVPQILDALRLSMSSNSIRPSTTVNSTEKTGSYATHASDGENDHDDSLGDDAEYLEVEYQQLTDDEVSTRSDGESSNAELPVEGPAGCSSTHDECDHHESENDTEDDLPLTKEEKVTMVDLLGRFVVQNDLDPDNLSYMDIETLVFSQMPNAKK
ncbi:tigger transposable element-derived protein 4-like [Diadema antillarum]|uniref:tigger transposable element-derived protein 4-like n=1 Tax=Diadema antillarum TaxID=105358 RepID=UPI003A864EBA